MSSSQIFNVIFYISLSRVRGVFGKLNFKSSLIKIGFTISLLFPLSSHLPNPNPNPPSVPAWDGGGAAAGPLLPLDDHQICPPSPATPSANPSLLSSFSPTHHFLRHPLSVAAHPTGSAPSPNHPRHPLSKPLSFLLFLAHPSHTPSPPTLSATATAAHLTGSVLPAEAPPRYLHLIEFLLSLSPARIAVRHWSILIGFPFRSHFYFIFMQPKSLFRPNNICTIDGLGG